MWWTVTMMTASNGINFFDRGFAICGKSQKSGFAARLPAGDWLNFLQCYGYFTETMQ